MKITVNGKEFQLYFGIKFIRELDAKYWFGEETVKFGAGLENAWFKLQSHDLVILNDVLAAALSTQFVFTDADFDNFFAAQTEEQLDQLYVDLVKNLETQPMTVKRVKQYEANLKAVSVANNPDEEEKKAPKKSMKA